MSQSYYDLLGVARDASTADVEAAYRERAKETHPDRSDAPDATERFKAVSRAKAVLTDPHERARYDRLGHAAYVDGDPLRSGAGRDVDESSSDGDPTRSRGTAQEREGTHERRKRREQTRRTRQTRRTSHDGQAEASATGTEARTDGFGAGFETSWEHASDEVFGSRHAATNRSRSWYRPGADGSDGYRVSTRDDRGIEFTAERIGVALLTFLLYPLFVASAFFPGFPLVVNFLVGLCTLALVIYLLSVPETGVLVFGGWTLLGPVALTVGGVGLLSGVGVLAWAFCWIPFVLAVANLLFLRA